MNMNPPKPTVFKYLYWSVFDFTKENWGDEQTAKFKMPFGVFIFIFFIFALAGNQISRFSLGFKHFIQNGFLPIIISFALPAILLTFLFCGLHSEGHIDKSKIPQDQIKSYQRTILISALILGFSLLLGDLVSANYGRYY